MAGTIERTLALKLVGDVSGLRKDLKPAQRQFGQFTKSITSWGKALSGAVVIGGLERVAGALGDAWKGYRSGQKAAAQLWKTWKNLGFEGQRYQGVLDKVTASTLRLGTSDDEAVEAFSRSLSRTRDYQQSLRELAVAQDLVASGAAGNLESAFRIIQQAGKGSARVVDRFGLTAKTSAGRIRELGDQVKGTAAAKAKLNPLGVLFNRMAEDTEAIVGAFAKGDFKGVVKGLQGLGETVADALFGPKGSDSIRNSKKAGLVNQFGKWGGELAKSIQTEFGKVDWGKTLQDTLNSGLGALKTAIENGTLANLATVAGAIALAIFTVDATVTALTALFSVPKLMVKGVISAITTVGVSIAGTMFGAEKVTTAAGSAIAGTIEKAAAGKAVGAAAAGAGLSIGGIIAAGIGALIAGAIVAGLTLATDEANRVPISLLASAKQARARGAKDRGSVAAQLRRSFPGATEQQIQRALWEAGFRPPPGFHTTSRGRQKTGFASGTSGAPPGWWWVGERGPELMRLPAGTQVMSNRASVAAAGSTVNVAITVNAPVASDGARAGAEIARYLDQWLARGGRFRYRPVGGLT